MFKRILVPFDGSKLSGQAFPAVASVAHAFGSEVFVVGVCGTEEGITRQSCSLFVDSGTDRLEKMIADSAVGLHAEVLEGNPAQQVLKFARDNRVDIIIATSHGRSGIKPWSLGKTVNNLLHEALPILIVRSAKGRRSGIFNRILVPLDGSEASYTVIAPLEALAGKLKMSITLVRVVEQEHPVHTLGGIDSVPYQDESAGEKEKEAGEYLDKIIRRLSGIADVKKVVRKGHPTREIVAEATQDGSTLIAMASHVHSALDTWFYGSVTQQLVNNGRFSFLLVPAPGS